MALGGCLAVPAARADLPWARLTAVFPPGMAAGTTNEVTVSGLDLDDSAGLHFSDPRIEATRHASHPSAFLVRVPPEVGPGRVEVRWAGRFGLSNPRPFVVGSGPEWLLQPTNTTPAGALDLPEDTVICGRMPSAQALWFRCVAEPGSRAGVRVLASEIGSRLEPVLRWFSESGNELGYVRGGDLDLVFPESGRCLVQVHDATFRGGDEHSFRLVVSGAPHLAFALPCVLQAGRTNRVAVFGRRLQGGRISRLEDTDGRPWERAEVDIVAPPRDAEGMSPADLPSRAASVSLAGAAVRWEWRFAGRSSNPILFPLTDDPVVVASLGTAGPACAPIAVRPPVEFSGIFPCRGEQSGVVFEAARGEVFWIELWAERLGFPCDPFAVVQRQRVTRGDDGEILYADVMELGDQDANPGGAEFPVVSRDPAGRFEAPEDGVYRVLVRDLFHSGPRSARFPYRLAIRRESPDFALAVVPVPPVRANDNDRAVHAVAPFLRRGQTELLKVVALRKDGFSGEIELAVSGLPDGVRGGETRIPAGQSVGFVPLTASDSASGILRPTVTGTARSGTNLLQRAAVWAVPGPVADSNEQAMTLTWAREPMASVSDVEWAPVSLVAAGGGPWDLGADGKLSLPVSVVRRGDFPGAFQVRLAGRAELDKGKEASIPEKATNATLELNLSEAKLPEGLHRVWLQGRITGKYRNQPEAVARAEEAFQAAERALAEAAEPDRKALEERRQKAEEQRKAAEERAKPRDVTFRVYSPAFELRVPPPGTP